MVANEIERHPPGRRLAAHQQRRVDTLDAFIDLVLDSGAMPTPEQIAQRAGVSRATFFRYFSTLDELRSDATERVFDRFPGLYDIPETAGGTREQRIAAFVDARLQLHETLHPLALLQRTHATRDAQLAEFVDAAREIMAAQARDHFEPDLRDLGPARREDIVTSIAVLTSVESWQQFRHSHSRTLPELRRTWQAALEDLLADRAR